MRDLIVGDLRAHRELVDLVVQQLIEPIEQAARTIVSSLRQGGALLAFGNGGSAADAQHMVAELVGRFEQERPAFRAVALTTDTSVLTALANDYGFERVYERQVEALARSGDVLLGISTSGRSPNVLTALDRGRSLGCATIGLTGKDGGDLAERCDVLIVVPSDRTARIQEMHITLVHVLSNLIERDLAAS